MTSAAGIRVLIKSDTPLFGKGSALTLLREGVDVGGAGGVDGGGAIGGGSAGGGDGGLEVIDLARNVRGVVPASAALIVPVSRRDAARRVLARRRRKRLNSVRPGGRTERGAARRRRAV